MVKRKTRHTKESSSTVNYRESSSDSDVHSEDVLEWAEEDEEEASNHPIESAASGSEVVERVLRQRDGVPGAVGSPTTWYNIQDKSDPNEGVENLSPSDLERQYLIKWVGWSHMHNTWESDKSLKQMNARGMKKLENFVKRQDEIESWRRTVDKEYIEVYDCEQEMNEELLEQYKQVERVIAHQISREKTEEMGEKTAEYFVKWSCLPYSECTWEDEGLIRRQYSDKIDEYYERFNAETVPGKSHPALRRRPKFQKLEEIPHFLRPRLESGGTLELRDYQLEGLNWLLHAWSKGNSCILADEMGLGKTIQAISFISSLFHLHDLYGPFLVVVPLSTMTAWQREFDLWGPKINSVVYMGDVNSREQIRQFELSSQGSKRLRANVIITTYEIVLKDKAFLGRYDWACLAVDEAHRLKNDESLLYQSLSSFSTNHRLLITGTPLQNSLKELWALLRFIMPEKFDDWHEFERAHQDRDHKGISSLHKKLEPFLLRRVKKDVEKSLPAKVEQILRVDMTTRQKQYYKLILTRNYDELSKGVKGSISGFINVMMELKKCCNHCCLVRNDDYMEEEAQARLQQLLKSSGKLILLDKLLCRLKETGHRVLIFSQMVMMLDLLQEYMQLRRFATQRLDGSMRADLRKQALDHFNAPGSNDFCFLLSTRAGGLGINLATADTVIIFDSDWNPQNDLQAMSRAHRIGQKNQVNIYRLVTKASVEEEIVERAKQKLVLDHLVIQRMDTTGKTVLSKNAMGQSSKSLFDKADLNAILKFGAEELFKERLDGEAQEPEVDIDDILRRAETRECENHQNDNELLNSFKYANFAIDEEKDLASFGQHDHDSNDGNAATDANYATTSAAGVDGGVGREDKDWKDIIPQDQVEQLKEEQRKKENENLYLGPRQRPKMLRETSADNSEDETEGGKKKLKKKKRGKKGNASDNSDDEDSSGDSDSGEETRGKKTYKRKILFNFTEKEIRRFTKSFRKFAMPLSRLDALAQDAELEEHSTNEIAELVYEFLRRFQESTAEYESEKQQKENGKSPVDTSIVVVKKKQDRGPIFKIGQVDVYVRPIMKMQSDLEPLHKAIEEFKAQLCPKFKIPGKPKRQLGWDVEWEDADDVSLLRGIYQYGLGSWEAIKMDPEFGLVDKIWLKDKVKKPQPKHLQSRAEYLLRHLAKAFKISESPPKKRSKTDPNGMDGGEMVVKKKDKLKNKKLESKIKDKHTHHHHQKKMGDKKGGKEDGGEEGSDSHNKAGTMASPSPSKKWRSEDQAQVASIKLNVPRYKNDLKDRKSAIFKKCVELFRPVHKAIKKLNGEKPHSEQGLRYLLKLGDHITGCIVKMIRDKEPTGVQDKWYNYLWIFLSMFLDAEQEPISLLNTYKQCVRSKDKEGGSHHSHTPSTNHQQCNKPVLLPSTTVTYSSAHSHHYIPPPPQPPKLQENNSRHRLSQASLPDSDS